MGSRGDAPATEPLRTSNLPAFMNGRNGGGPVRCPVLEIEWASGGGASARAKFRVVGRRPVCSPASGLITLMKMNIDLKSVLFGLALGAITMLAVGTGDSAASRPLGRYQGAAAQGLLLIVDTATGQAWAL